MAQDLSDRGVIAADLAPPGGIGAARPGRRLLLGAAAATLAAPRFARAQATAADAGNAAGATLGGREITVSGARNAPIPIALPAFAGSALGPQITGVITSDLVNCGLFRAVPGGVADASGTPDFQMWKNLGTQALVTGDAADAGGGQVRVEMRLWDVIAGQQLQGTAYTTSGGNWRRIAHIIADVIYQRLLGEPGYFDTRIAYVSRTGPRGRQVTRLAVMDQDGANVRYLTDGRWLVLTPRWHPTRDEIVFMSYTDNRPRVYLFNLQTGSQSVLGEFQGMSFAPRFSPNGDSVILSATHNGASNIYVVGLGSRRMTQLTNTGAIDTSPCYSPDGSQIVFNSDRAGNQQLYVMSASGGGARRISYGAGQYATPVWSPRGDLIAFTRLGAGPFSIGVMQPDGTGERLLAQGFVVESPTFCPNGRVLAYSTETAATSSSGAGYGSRIGSVDITGFNQRQIPTPTNASDPAWSPLNA